MSTPKPRPDDAMLQAAQWFVLLASGEASADERRRWQAWRAAHPANEQAWQRAEGCAAPFERIPPEQAAVVVKTLEGAPRQRSRTRRKTLAGLALFLGAGMLGWQGYRASDWSADLATRVGEQRETILADGSRLVLDTHSAVDIDFSPSARIVRLRRGRIMVATAPQAAPFVVDTAQGHVRALGTRFTVQQDTGSTSVAVQEARVALHALHATGADTILAAGQSARFDSAGRIARTSAPPGGDAWTKGMLVADDMRLADLLAELARYREAPLACDSAAAQLRISGAFPVRETERALAAVSATLPVRVERQDGGALLLRAK